MEAPTFSIIVPTYNRAWILERTLKSIFNQSCTDWELIIIDDGSTDATESVVAHAKKTHNEIIYRYQPNAGAAAARQYGLSLAHGKWVTYVDSDDELYPQYLSTALQFFDEHTPVFFAMCNVDREIVLEDKQHNTIAHIVEPPTTKDPQLITLQDYAHWIIKPCGTGIFCRRDIITENIVWDSSFRLLEDIDYLMQLGLRYPEHFGFIPDKIFHQYQMYGNDGVCSGADYADWATYFEKFYLKHQNHPLMRGQTWYPSKVEKYREKQKQYDAGQILAAYTRYFPEYFAKVK